MSKIVGDIAVTIGADITPLQSNLKRGSAEVINFGAKAEEMGKRIKTAGTDANKLGGAMGRLSNVSRQTRAQIQNASYQFQDMAVQFQMGTKTSTILAQQLPQLAGAFGPVGAAIGVLAGVGIPALVYAFGDIFDSAESMEEVLKKLKSAVDAYAAAGDLAILTTEELEEKFGTASAGLMTTLNLLEQISRNEAQRTIDGIGESLANMLGTSGDGESRSALADFFDVNIMFAFTDAQRSAREEARRLTAEFQNHQQALANSKGNIDAQISAMHGLLRSAQGLARATDGISDAEEEVIRKIAETLVLMEQQRGKVEEVEKATVSFAEAVKAAYDNLAAQGPLIDGLIGKVNALAQAAWNYAGAMGATSAGRGRGSGTEMQDGRRVFRDQLRRQDRWTAPRPRRGGGRGGRAGGASGPDQDDFEALRDRFATEAELVAEKYAKDMERLREFREAKLATEAEFNELERRMRKDHSDSLTKLDKDAFHQKLQLYSGALGDVASLMQSENDKLFKIGKVAAIARATVEGISAASAAWDKGMVAGGPPVAAAFAGASLLKTAGFINSLNSASPSGAGGGMVGGGTAAGGVAAAPAQRRLAEFQLTGTNVQGGRELVDALNEAIRDGYEINISYAG